MLWETDHDDPEDLRREWFGKRNPRPAISVPAVDEQAVCLREENGKLRSIIQGLQRQVAKLSTTSGCGYTSCAPKKTVAQRQLDAIHWLDKVGPLVAQMPRMVEDILPSLKSTEYCHGAIKFDLHVGNTSVAASTVLAHCQSTVQSLYSRHPAIFKIGLTKCPVARWSNDAYGYKHDIYDKWSGMTVMFVHEDSFPAGLVESALIQYFQHIPGCRNVNPGGEGVDGKCPGPYFTYVVYRILKPPT